MSKASKESCKLDWRPIKMKPKAQIAWVRISRRRPRKCFASRSRIRGTGLNQDLSVVGMSKTKGFTRYTKRDNWGIPMWCKTTWVIYRSQCKRRWSTYHQTAKVGRTVRTRRASRWTICSLAYNWTSVESHPKYPMPRSTTNPPIYTSSQGSRSSVTRTTTGSRRRTQRRNRSKWCF